MVGWTKASLLFCKAGAFGTPHPDGIPTAHGATALHISQIREALNKLASCRLHAVGRDPILFGIESEYFKNWEQQKGCAQEATSNE